VTISEQKREARSKALAARRALSPTERREKSVAIGRSLLGLAAFRRASRVHLYLSLWDEVQTDEVIRAALASSKEVVVPVVVKHDSNRELRLIRIEEFPPKNLEKGPLGISQPGFDSQAEVSPEEIDFWVIPGIAFDPSGRRLGYGLGYYDRILKRTKGLVAALAFEVQIQERLPEGAEDVRVRTIITEKRVIDCVSSV
jgi:5-formyltetrahydrofolate cyclo-ligase